MGDTGVLGFVVRAEFCATAPMGNHLKFRHIVKYASAIAAAVSVDDAAPYRLHRPGRGMIALPPGLPNALHRRIGFGSLWLPAGGPSFGSIGQ